MKKLLFALLVATICVACEKEGEKVENPVGSAVSQFSPDYGQVPRDADPSPLEVKGELPIKEGDSSAIQF
jgi:hypothetical protein